TELPPEPFGCSTERAGAGGRRHALRGAAPRGLKRKARLEHASPTRPLSLLADHRNAAVPLAAGGWARGLHRAQSRSLWVRRGPARRARAGIASSRRAELRLA